MRNPGPVLLTTALAMIAGAASAAEQFDLACTGQMALTAIQGAPGARPAPPRPFTSRYRIDLGSKRWCAAGCGVINPVASASQDRIVLQETPGPTGGQALTLNRVNGQLDGQVQVADPARGLQAHGVLRAQCKRLGFSGFPPHKF